MQNATTNKTAIEVGVDCGSGCLFNIRDDPSEYSDLAQANPSKLAELRERFFALNSTAFHQLKLPQDEEARRREQHRCRRAVPGADL